MHRGCQGPAGTRPVVKSGLTGLFMCRDCRQGQGQGAWKGSRASLIPIGCKIHEHGQKLQGQATGAQL